MDMTIDFPKYLEASFPWIITILGVVKALTVTVNISMKFTDGPNSVPLPALVLKLLGLAYSHVKTTIAPFRPQDSTDIEWEKEAFLIFLNFILASDSESPIVYGNLVEKYGNDFVLSYNPAEANPVNDYIIELMGN